MPQPTCTSVIFERTSQENKLYWNSNSNNVLDLIIKVKISFGIACPCNIVLVGCTKDDSNPNTARKLTGLAVLQGPSDVRKVSSIGSTVIQTMLEVQMN